MQLPSKSSYLIISTFLVLAIVIFLRISVKSEVAVQQNATTEVIIPLQPQVIGSGDLLSETIFSPDNLGAISIHHEKEIAFAQTGTFIGHFEAYSSFIRHGILSCFKKINEQGGIQGKMLRLISVEDFGNPEQAEKNIRTLKEMHHVDINLGVMGTRALLKILPMVKNREIAALFPWGGDDTVRKAECTYLVNGLGLIKPQIRELVRHITQDLKMDKIGIFHSDSSFDAANAEYAVKLLAEAGLKPIAVGVFSRLAMNIGHANKKLISGDPKAVLCICLSLPAVKLIKSFFEEGDYGTYFFGVDSTFMVKEMLATNGVRFRYASSMPDPYSTRLAIAGKYRSDLARYYPDDKPNILSFAYYIHAAIIARALASVHGTFTKDKLVKQIEMMKNENIDGFKVDFDPVTRQAYHHGVTLIDAKYQANSYKKGGQ